MTKSKEEIKTFAIESLKKIRTIFPTARIFGGCPRDLHFGNEVSDIDIFVTTNDLNTLSRIIVEKMGQTGIDFIENKIKYHFEDRIKHTYGLWISNSHGYDFMKDIIITHKFRPDNSFPEINLIILKNNIIVNDYIDTFDFPICRVELSDSGEILIRSSNFDNQEQVYEGEKNIEKMGIREKSLLDWHVTKLECKFKNKKFIISDWHEK